MTLALLALALVTPKQGSLSPATTFDAEVLQAMEQELQLEEDPAYFLGEIVMGWAKTDPGRALSLIRKHLKPCTHDEDDYCTCQNLVETFARLDFEECKKFIGELNDKKLSEDLSDAELAIRIESDPLKYAQSVPADAEESTIAAIYRNLLLELPPKLSKEIVAALPKSIRFDFLQSFVDQLIERNELETATSLLEYLDEYDRYFARIALAKAIAQKNPQKGLALSKSLDARPTVWKFYSRFDTMWHCANILRETDPGLAYSIAAEIASSMQAETRPNREKLYSYSAMLGKLVPEHPELITPWLNELEAEILAADKPWMRKTRYGEYDERPHFIMDLAGIYSYFDLIKADELAKRALSLDPRISHLIGHHNSMVNPSYAHYIFNKAKSDPEVAQQELRTIVKESDSLEERNVKMSQRQIAHALAEDWPAQAVAFGRACADKELEVELADYYAIREALSTDSPELAFVKLAPVQETAFDLVKGDVCAQIGMKTWKVSGAEILYYLDRIASEEDRLEALLHLARKIWEIDREAGLSVYRKAFQLVSHSNGRKIHTLHQILQRERCEHYSSYYVLPPI